MADEDQTNGAQANQPAADTENKQPQVPQMRILGQFIRDMSFENIVAQKGVGGDAKPDVRVQVSLDARKRKDAENQYEVISKFNVTSRDKNGDATLFVLELEYGGIFQVDGVPQEQLHPYLMIECPRMLFPFVRRIVSDVTRDGGFAPLNLDNVDFVALYRQMIAERQKQQQAAQPTN
ncbi:protein-export chaperone SecB [Tranquillimonas alkanivorans]|uniref:Protein-export protein SecB n=1 Tax=Tranquillimonas alkanivorans TaxID=441119 RepID=A0A1I5LHD1_9RHOB|nr:protein-export chaperone SecB [Tranquillimonas alkanivorans]SFO96784.1 protein translocase subunit secB [Tranquillimonas alkanivorans]